MSRQEDFHEQAEKYANECGGTTQEKCAAMTDYSTGCEHGYQYAVEKVLKELFMIELSNFFPELDEVNTTAGQQRLIECIKQAMEEL